MYFIQIYNIEEITNESKAIYESQCEFACHWSPIQIYIVIQYENKSGN